MKPAIILLAHLTKVQFSAPRTFYIIGAYWLLLSYIFSLVITQLDHAHITPVFWWAGFASIFLIPCICLNSYQKGEGDSFFGLLRTLGPGYPTFTLCYFIQILILILTLDSMLGLHLLFICIYASPDLGLHFAALGGLFLLQIAFASLSLFLSSITRDQLLYLIITILSLLGLWLLSYADQLFSGSLLSVGQFLKASSPYRIFTHLMSGSCLPTDLLIMVIWITFPPGLAAIQGDS